MANKTCGHLGKCGCETYLTTPPPCPTPENCPDPQPCSEVFDAQCILYTGPDLECGQDVVIAQNTSVALALEDLVSAVCNASQLLTIPTNVICGEDTVVVAGVNIITAIEDVVTYFCGVIDNLPVPNAFKYTDTLVLATLAVVPINHNLNSTFVTVQLIDDASNTLLVHGTDYVVNSYTANSLNVSRTDAGGLTRIIVIG